MQLVKPWSRQRALQKRYADEEVPDIDELVTILESIRFGKDDRFFRTKQARALFALYYLTACRLTEIIPVTSLRKQRIRKREVINKKGERSIRFELDDGGNPIIDKEIVDHNYVGVMKKDIKFEKIDGRPVMFIRTENRKHRTRKTKRQPIPIEFEMPIVYYVNNYTELLDDTSHLFGFRDKRATQIINETTGFNVHFIRHIRATHLVTKYDFNEQMLIRFMGWTDGRPAKNYMELKSTDLFRQFYKNKHGDNQ